MSWNPQGHASLLLWLVLSLHILYFTTAVYAKSGRPITDAEIRMKKDECYTDIESGLWGLDCKASITAKENCALRCLSPRCYELVYESDPLEEGEKDLIRSQEYKYCMYSTLEFEDLSSMLLVDRSHANGRYDGYRTLAEIQSWVSTGESLDGIKGSLG